MSNNKIENLIIPSVTDSSDKHMRSQDIFSYLLKYRIIYLSGEVEERMAAIINATLMVLNAEDGKKTYLFIYSFSRWRFI